MKSYQLNIEKNIFHVTDEVMPSDNSNFFSGFIKCKILLMNEKQDRWYLTPRYGYYYKNLPSIENGDIGIYAFWSKHKENYIPLEIGSGILSHRIPNKYWKLSLEVERHNLFLSFKTTFNKEEALQLEQHYIEKLNPIFNKQHNDCTSETYCHNLNNFHIIKKQWHKPAVSSL